MLFMNFFPNSICQSTFNPLIYIISEINIFI